MRTATIMVAESSPSSCRSWITGSLRADAESLQEPQGVRISQPNLKKRPLLLPRDGAAEWPEPPYWPGGSGPSFLLDGAAITSFSRSATRCQFAAFRPAPVNPGDERSSPHLKPRNVRNNRVLLPWLPVSAALRPTWISTDRSFRSSFPRKVRRWRARSVLRRRPQIAFADRVTRRPNCLSRGSCRSVFSAAYTSALAAHWRRLQSATAVWATARPAGLAASRSASV